MSPENTRRRTRPVRGAVVAIAATGLLGAGVIAWQTVGTDETSPSDQEQQIRSETNRSEPPSGDAPDNGLDWDVTEPMLDLGGLADVHASSRLQYDECQQGYADVATEPSSGSHPLYFC